MKKTLLAIAGIGLLSAFLAHPVLSHNPGGFMGQHMAAGEHMGAGGHHGAWFDNDALTEEQQQAIDKLRNDFAAETKELRLKLRQKAAELQAVLASPTPDQATARKIQKELNSLRNTLAEKRLDIDLQVNQIAPEAMAGNGLCAGPGQGRGRHNMMSR
ncbi:MAG: periplasmic heavy metal sensor [Desulfobulbaceae bacterium]|nr:periplasmic heavy metal sensor [Desulfobulbaceae bacterium]